MCTTFQLDENVMALIPFHFFCLLFTKQWVDK